MSFITDFIHARTRSEWQEFFDDGLNRLRDYVRAHGEAAALIAFGAGVLIVVFYKLALVLACIGVLAHQLILIIAKDTRD
jgi:hypothetical protein